MKLTQEYLASRLENLNTQNSWEKAVLESVLKATILKLQAQNPQESNEEVIVSVDFTVKQLEEKDIELACFPIEVCVSDNYGGRICTHICI